MPVETENPAIDVNPLRPDEWRAIARLFGDNGACGGCWCMWWRVPRGGKLWEEVKGRKNRDGLRRLVRAGSVHAVVAYSGGEPVGWCSFGPRHSFPRLERVRALRRKVPEDTWSIVCFFIPARWRGRGVATRLLRAATAEAFARGAREIEGYPVVPKKGTVPAAFAWTGVPALFRSSGYLKLRRPSATRPIYVRKNP
jgi:GNAT superfamily N-acetyltransferase